MLRKLLNRPKTARTQDREATPILTTEKIGPKQSLTKEGYLFCEDVPLARVGEMLYTDGEVPVEAGPDGLIRITRDAEELFSPETVASFTGKSVTDEHPPGHDVNPSNWAQVTKGICLNPRRGEGDDSDVLMGDLLITDKELIAAIRGNKREVSAGYDALYRKLAKGHGRQSSIIGNHIALVERGRCGPRCAIGDHQSISQEQSDMGTKTQQVARRPLTNPVSRAVQIQRFRDAAEALEQLGEPDAGISDGDEDGDPTQGSATHIHIHAGGGSKPSETVDEPEGAAPGADPNEARFVALEQGHTKIMEMIGGLSDAIAKLGAPANTPAPAVDEKPDDAPPAKKDDDEEGKTGDSAALATSYIAVVADAEVLVPGFRFPTFDATQPRAVTIDSMCSLRRRVIDSAYATASGKQVIDSVTGDQELDLTKKTCADVATLFKAAAGARRLLNNQASTRDAGIATPGMTQNQSIVSGPKSIADINAANKEFYARQKK